jgi:hypothetical protein
MECRSVSHRLVSNWCQLNQSERHVCGSRPAREHGGEGADGAWTTNARFIPLDIHHYDLLADEDLTDTPKERI